MQKDSPLYQAKDFFIYKMTLVSILKEVHDWNIGFNKEIAKVVASAELELEIESEWDVPRNYDKISKLELVVESWSRIKLQSDVILKQLSKVFEKSTDYARMEVIKELTVGEICVLIVFKDNIDLDVIQSTLKAGKV